MIHFPVSGVETYWWFPPLVAMIVSMLTSPAGLSGAFVMLPFQVSVLGYGSPGVTSTNLLFNIIAIPGGIYRFYREKRMVWPLVWVLSLGTVPGLALGVFIRVRYLPDPAAFKLFVGLVLFYIAVRLIFGLKDTGRKPRGNTTGRFEVDIKTFTAARIEYEFNGERYRAPSLILGILSLIVGIIGGIYGIGGGAILAPILVTLYRLPVHTISGAALCSTFLTSVLGVVFYIFLAPLFSDGQVVSSPDWFLGLSIGVGGLVGIYIGARLQKYMPERVIKSILALIMIFIATRYILGFFQ